MEPAPKEIVEQVVAASEADRAGQRVGRHAPGAPGVRRTPGA
ncbi:MAG: hypothetical protein AB7H43_08290 [Acidimicrobiia bacterium]